jgi:hypothetical protein
LQQGASDDRGEMARMVRKIENLIKHPKMPAPYFVVHQFTFETTKGAIITTTTNHEFSNHSLELLQSLI